MSVLISGALINGAGVPMAECKIYLDALVNTSEVVTESFAVIETDAAGQYAFEAQKGKYTVHIKQKNGPKCCVGDITVYDDSKPGTLNDFLTALDEDDLKPDVVKRFEEMVAQAQQSAEAAAESKQEAGKHAADAAQAKKDCQTLADNVQQDAEAVAASKQQVEQLASEVEMNAGQVQHGAQDVADAVKQAMQAAKDSADSAADSKNSADNAALSEQNAQKHAQKAEKHEQQSQQYAQDAATAAESAENAKGEIDEILEGGYLKIKNGLQEIVDAGQLTLDKAQRNLQIRGVANKTVISNPFTWPDKARMNSTLALAGAYGFGYTYEDEHYGRISFNSASALENWANYARPGRYYHKSDGYTPIYGVNFEGIIDVLWLNPNMDNYALRMSKVLIFYGINKNVLINATFAGTLGSWEEISLTKSKVRSMLYSYVNYDWGDPDIGGLTIAAYQDITGQQMAKIKRGDTCQGSYLTPVGITASGAGITSISGYVSGYSKHSLPGTYKALSGCPDISSMNGFVVALFMRIA
ncbi:prophage tail fiber N-terminal domain-containing protein [Escherichia albertii]|uniref:prophage tail fiber N-terminal domain-containing protein n=1 Tax=Escherichia albertii TaxID=208962 RepID=UPI001957475B|nr:prophage tail fiber N-terminal domain-containing protein [Escherichia albertii]QST26689.1 prophage tail fiber N-terminal domain-containing protein [Escherichia albertii]QST36056.1 prophage tail fiber N-terminal domain-containing protein [Escherichia albertii]